MSIQLTIKQRIEAAERGSWGESPTADPGEPDSGTCKTDGHYMCHECTHAEICECGEIEARCECPDDDRREPCEPPSAPVVVLTVEEATALAGRWARSPEDPDASQRRSLLGWVADRMAEEVEARASTRRAHAAHVYGWVGDHAGWDGLRDNDREALAHAIAGNLASDDPHGEHGLAWTLCELAGWPDAG